MQRSILTVLLAGFTAFAQANDPNGDGGLATTTLIHLEGVAFRAGSLYLTDGSRIGKIAPNGIITTVAGLLDPVVHQPIPGFSGDNGPALGAQLSGAVSLDFDTAGNLYIADGGNSCIRKVTARVVGGVAQPFNGTEIITTVVGIGTVAGNSNGTGLATTATLNAPRGIAVDPASGALYIADQNNNNIRMVDPSGMITTLAGTGVAGFQDGAAGSARFNFPTGVTVDPVGNVYVADVLNSRVRKISGGTVTTFAGTGASSASGNLNEGGAAIAANVRPVKVRYLSGILYVVDSGIGTLRQINIGTGIIFTVAGSELPAYVGPFPPVGDGGPALAALLGSGPSGIQDAAIDDANDFFITDASSQRVRFVANPSTATIFGQTVAAENIATVAGPPVPQTISFTTPPPTSAPYQSQFTVAATGGGSGNPVTFTSSGVCTNVGATYTMTSSTGTCAVIANQASNTNYAAAPTVTVSVIATQAPQTITFSTNAPASAAYGNSFTVAATGGGSGNPVTFTSSGSCTNSGATYTMTSGTGTCTVIANQLGNSNYLAAPTVTESVSAMKAVLTVTATSFTQPYGTPIPAPTYSFSGFVSPDTSSVVSGTLVLTTTATATSLPGAYPITITQGTLAAANYTFNLVNGTLTITLPVGPGLCVPFPVTLAAPAGPSGAAVTLTSSNPSIVDFSPGVNPIIVIILAGATSPQRNEIPQVCGVQFGTATVSASPGVTTTSQTVTVEVTATLSFAYTSVTATAGSQARVELDLSAPARAPGLTVNLTSSNTAVATVPSTIVIPANQTSLLVPVAAVATGSATIAATTLAPNVPGTTTSITVH